jgi:hypothetical protein
MGDGNHVVVSHKLCAVQENVGWRVVVMKELVVVALNFRYFSSHILSQVFQNLTGEVRVDRTVRRNKFTVKIPCHLDKSNEHSFCCTLDLPLHFCSGDCGVFHCDDSCLFSVS